MLKLEPVMVRDYPPANDAAVTEAVEREVEDARTSSIEGDPENTGY